MALRRAARRYPRYFVTKNRTQFLAYVAAYEPVSMVDLGALIEAESNAVLARYLGLEQHGVVVRFKSSRVDGERSKWLVALNRGHPASHEIRELLRELNRRIPLPNVRVERRRDPMPSFRVRRQDGETMLGMRIQRRSLILLGVLGAADAMLLSEIWRSGFCPTWLSMDALVRAGILKRDPRTSVARLTISPRLVARRQFISLLRALAELNDEYEGFAEHARDDRSYLRKRHAK
jgi:hypothetical protein